MTTSEFCANCLSVIDEVHASGVSVLMAKGGKPYLILEPFYGETIPVPGEGSEQK